MSYRIRVTRSPVDSEVGKWVKDLHGAFAYLGYDDATVFTTYVDAVHALSEREAVKQKNGYNDLGFDIVDAATQYIRTDAAKQHGYLFVGGPLDGQRFAVPDGSINFMAQRPCKDFAAWATTAGLNDVFEFEQLLYLRHEIRAGVDLQAQRHIVFVYAGPHPRRPAVNEWVRFRDRDYRITRKSYDGKVLVFAEYPYGMTRKTEIEVEEKDIVKAFASSVWIPRYGATINILESSTVTAP